MIAPGALVIFTPLLVGIVLGYRCLSGYIAGVIVSGI
jgi:inorganic pyrophosphatase